MRVLVFTFRGRAAAVFAAIAALAASDLRPA